MSRKGVRLVLLCEDDEHQRFAQRAFLALGFHFRELRFFVSPTGRGAADKWILDTFAKEARAHRRRRTTIAVT